MLFSQTFFYLLIGLGTAIGLPALWLFVRAKWPQMIDRSRSASSRSLLLSFLVGAPVMAILLGIASKMGSSGVQPLQVSALLLAGLTLVWALAGIAGLATHVGESLWPSLVQGEQAWKTTWNGGLVVVGCLLLPFIGWFFLLLLLPVIGAGIQVRSFFKKKEKRLVAEATPEVSLAA
jgi:hypothetical protein